jgi:hypothetical protein
MPTTTIGSAIPVRYGVSTPTRLSQAMPISMTAIPPMSSRPFPSRRVRPGTATAIARTTSICGRKAKAASTGLSPLTPWRYWVMKKVELTSAPVNRKRAA